MDHAYLPVANFDETWKFWTNTLSLKPIRVWGESPDRAGQVALGNSRLVVAQVEQGVTEQFGYRVEYGKPQIFIQTKNIQEVFKQIRNRGAKVIREPFTTHWGPKAFSIEGPEGMIVGFIDQKT